jgi:hypothetical protein
LRATVSKGGNILGVCGHPSRLGATRLAPQDEV